MSAGPPTSFRLRRSHHRATHSATIVEARETSQATTSAATITDTVPQRPEGGMPGLLRIVTDSCYALALG